MLVKGPERVFYGWWVVLASGIIAAMGGGFYSYGFTVFFLPISAELNLSRAAVSTVFAVARLEGAFEGPIVGWIIDRYGARKPMVVGLLLFAVGYAAMYWMNSLLTFFLLYAAVIAVGYQAGFVHTQYALANKWFIRQRTKATAVVSVAFGLGGVVIVPMLGWLIAQYGWRMAVVIAGTSVLIIGLPLCLVIRNVPEEKGLLPDGDEAEKKEVVKRPDEAAGDVSFTVKEAMKTRAFWILTVASILRTFVVGAMWVHMVPLLVFKGFDEQGATYIISLLLVFTLPSRMLSGWLGDIYSKRYLLMLACLIVTVSLIVLLAAQSLWQLYLFITVFALGYGAWPLDYAIVAEYFGRKNYATIRAIMAMTFSAGIITGPIYAGYIYDITQSYYVAFCTFIVIYSIAAMLFIFARHPKSPAAPTAASTVKIAS